MSGVSTRAQVGGGWEWDRGATGMKLLIYSPGSEFKAPLASIPFNSRK